MKSQKEINLKNDLDIRDRLDIYRNFLLYCMSGDVVSLPMGSTGSFLAFPFLFCDRLDVHHNFLPYCMSGNIVSTPTGSTDLQPGPVFLYFFPFFCGKNSSKCACLLHSPCIAHCTSTFSKYFGTAHDASLAASAPAWLLNLSLLFPAVVVERDSSEFARLSQLGDVLGLNPLEISQVHTGLAEQAYRNQVQQVASTPSSASSIL
jgi:hypothetical protein